MIHLGIKRSSLPHISKTERKKPSKPKRLRIDESNLKLKGEERNLLWYVGLWVGNENLISKFHKILYLVNGIRIRNGDWEWDYIP